VGGNAPFFLLAVPPLFTELLSGIWAYFFSRTWLTAEQATRHFHASAYRVRRFVREHAVADRLHISLWLVRIYVISAGIYGCQIWGTKFLQAVRESLFY